MQGSSVKSVARQIGMLGVLTIVVTILTFLFNLVGTLCVSIIAGMMTGASRRCNWQVVSVSLVPPVVALALGYFTKVDFNLRQWLSVAGIALGSFWGTWLATCLLMFLEKKSDAAPGEPASIRSSPPQELKPTLQRGDSPTGGWNVHPALKTNAPESELNLDDLQGTWFLETDGVKESSRRKMFVVKQGKFSLSIVNSNGHARLLAQGELTVQGEEGRKNLAISRFTGFEAGEI